MTKSLEHPYWDIYSKLINLRNGPVTSSGKELIRQLAKDADIAENDRLAMEVKMALPFFKSQMI